MQKEEHEWLKGMLLEDLTEDDVEVRKVVLTHSVQINSWKGMTNQIFSKFSDWTILKKSVAWLLRYKNWLLRNIRSINETQSGIKSDRLSTEELRDAECAIVKCVQNECLAEELKLLQSPQKLIRRSSQLCMVKRYGVIFTCLTIRAIHIEIVFSMDTGSFINALRRFLSKRGRPEQIRCDNGPNFRSGEREIRTAIQQWNQNLVHKFLLQKDIKWIFNPPTASHMGVVRERAIRLVRRVLNAILRNQTVDDEGLYTLLCEVEAMIS